ncbi:hypothetical protein [Holospora undulata]|uniref:Uncharacterized protein n=1 Tax=Holospora undulata HU1 TaxID=1321371 RepID=A0A061JI50_9PROT|nr:hypothetical protein [Holospora undulata]ETZ04674.1 hypothetical protein K737_300894 [Holospora undulata HU1]
MPDTLIKSIGVMALMTGGSNAIGALIGKDIIAIGLISGLQREHSWVLPNLPKESGIWILIRILLRDTS